MLPYVGIRAVGAVVLKTGEPEASEEVHKTGSGYHARYTVAKDQQSVGSAPLFAACDVWIVTAFYDKNFLLLRFTVVSQSYSDILLVIYEYFRIDCA